RCVLFRCRKADFARPGVDGRGFVARVDGEPRDPKVRSVFMRPRPVEECRQLVPSVMPVRPALDHDVIDEPALKPSPPGPDIDLDALLLDIRARRQEQPARWYHAWPPRLAAIVEPLPVRRLAGFDPCLAEDSVAERLDRLVGALGRLPAARGPGPAEPAHRRVECREVVADRRGISGRGGCPPFAALQHRRLVVLRDGLITALAEILRRLRLALLPAQPIELQPLHRPAMRARDEVAPLVGRLELALD